MAAVASPLPKRLVFDSTITAAKEKRVLQAVEEISQSERMLEGLLQQEQRKVHETIRKVQNGQIEKTVGSKHMMLTSSAEGRQLIPNALLLARLNGSNELPITLQQHAALLSQHGSHTKEHTKQAQQLAMQRAQELAHAHETDNQIGEQLLAETRSRKAALREVHAMSTSRKALCNEQSVGFHAEYQAKRRQEDEGIRRKEEKKQKRQENQQQAAARAAAQRERQQVKEKILAIKHNTRKLKAGVDSALARLGAFHRAALEAPQAPGESFLFAMAAADTDDAMVAVPVSGDGGSGGSSKGVALEQVHVQLQAAGIALDLQRQLKDSKGRWQLLSEQLEWRLSMVAERQAALQGSQFPVTAMSEAGVGRVALPNGMEVELQVPPSWPAAGSIRLLDIQAPTACPQLQAVLERLKPQLQAGAERLDGFLGQVWGALREAGLA